MVCLLSHGVEGAVYGTDGQLLQVCFNNAFKGKDETPITDLTCIVSVTWSFSARLGV